MSGLGSRRAGGTGNHPSQGNQQVETPCRQSTLEKKLTEAESGLGWVFLRVGKLQLSLPVSTPLEPGISVPDPSFPQFNSPVTEPLLCLGPPKCGS